MRRTGIALALALVALPARAQTSAAFAHTSRLTYVAPRACPSEQVFRDLVAAQTSTKVFAPLAPAHLAVTVARRARQYEATAELRDQADAVLWMRPFAPTSSCSGLVEDIAVYVSAKLDSRPKDPSPAPRPAPELSPPPTPSDGDTVHTSPLVFVVGLGATLGFGVAPRVAAGLTADVGIHYAVDAGPLDGLSLSLGLRWDPPASRSIPLLTAVLPDVEVTSSRLVGVGAPCFHVWTLFGCGLVEAGNLHLGAGNATVRAGGDRLYFALGGRLGVEVPFAPHVGFRGFGEALSALTFATTYINRIPVYTSPRPHASVGAGLYVFF